MAGILEAFLAGKEARRVADAQEQINAMQSFIGQNGQAIMAGDQNALGQLAGFGAEGLGMAMNVQGNVEARADRAYNRERNKVVDEREDQKLELEMQKYAAGLTAEQRAAEAAKIDEVLAGASHFYNKGDEAGYANWLKSKGLDPAQYAFADFPAHAVTGEKALAALTATAPPKPEGPLSTPGKVQADINAGLLPADTPVQGPETVVNMGGGSDKQVFDTIAASGEKAGAALVGLNGLSEASKALDGGAITGFAADQRLFLSKLGNYIGVTDPAAVENTETFRAAIAPQVSAMIKATVGSANISNADREFAEKAAAGSIQLDEASIKRMIKIMDKMGREAVRLHNEKVDTVYPAGGAFDRERALFLLPEPPPPGDTPNPTPAGDDIPTWNQEKGVWE
jgi:hypothetical protein